MEGSGLQDRERGEEAEEVRLGREKGEDVEVLRQLLKCEERHSGKGRGGDKEAILVLGIPENTNKDPNQFTKPLL